MKIQVGRNISMVQKGRSYNGILGIGGRTLMFELRLRKPLLEMGLKRDLSGTEFRTTVPFTLKKKDGQAVDLVDKEYAFFAKLLLRVVLEPTESGDVIAEEATDDLIQFLTRKLGCIF